VNYARTAVSDARRFAIVFGALSLICFVAQPPPWLWFAGGALFGVGQGILQSQVFRIHRSRIGQAITKAEYYAPMWSSREGRPLLVASWVVMALVAAAAYWLRPSDFLIVLLGFFSAATSAQLFARLPIMLSIARESSGAPAA
jgi:hypothetical protein